MQTPFRQSLLLYLGFSMEFPIGETRLIQGKHPVELSVHIHDSAVEVT